MSESRIRLTQNFSLYPRHVKALEWLLTETGGVNKSAIVQSLFEQAMRQRFGPDWLRVIERDSVDARTELAAAS